MSEWRGEISTKHFAKNAQETGNGRAEINQPQRWNVKGENRSGKT